MAKTPRREVVEMRSAVANNLRHFLLDSTKRRLLRDWLRGVKERQLQINYCDPIYGVPPREQIEDVLREQVVLEISTRRAAA